MKIYRAFFHERFCFGDRDHGLDLSKYDSFPEMAKEEFGYDDVYRPVYVSNRNGLSFSTTPFETRSGSTQLGFVFARKCDIRRTFGNLSHKSKILAEGLLIDEVEKINKEHGVTLEERV